MLTLKLSNWGLDLGSRPSSDIGPISGMRLLLEVELSFLPDACPSLGARPSLFHIQNLKILVAKRLGFIQQILSGYAADTDAYNFLAAHVERHMRRPEQKVPP